MKILSITKNIKVLCDKAENVDRNREICFKNEY